MPQEPENPQANLPTPGSEVARISVLAAQAELIGIQQRRLHRLLDREDMSGKYSRETTALIEGLWAFYTAYLRTEQELGLKPAYRRGPRPPEPAASDEVLPDAEYSFMTPDEVRDKVMFDELEKEGKIDPIEMYKVFGAIFQYEQKQLAKKRRS
jgi:hypothetical protein